jgi:hypothetical protein
VITSSSRRALSGVSASIAAFAGSLVALRYHSLGLTLSHYDSRGHLVVARRIIDSITPGWQQIGAVWLPLPHLLNALPAQIDFFYRTGATAVAMSILAFAMAASAIVWIVHTLTDSVPAAIAGAAVFALNPNILYLQATPMTEPLLLALTMVAVALLIDWCEDVGAKRQPLLTSAIGWVFALACLTRYEAWPVTACALGGAIWALWRNGEPFMAASTRVAGIAAYPALAIAAFVAFSRVVIGRWFVSSGFFVPENKALGDPMLALAEIWWGTHTLSGYLIVIVATVGSGVLLMRTLLSRRDARALIALAPLAAALLPWAAFYRGHPFRIRYMVPLIAMEAIGAGVAAGYVATVGRVKARLAAVSALSGLIVVALALVELHPFDLKAPMVVEAQWDRPNTPVRAGVTACLGLPSDDEKIMASMGSLGHYMQETSRAGFAIRDFLHEGNGDIWLAALNEGPRPFAEWVLIEEKAEGGDMLARRAREHPHFLDGYSRVCEGAGLALYRRDDHQNLTLNTSR